MTASCLGAPTLRSVGTFAMSEPAFAHVVGSDLVITSFSGSPFTAGSVWWVANFTGKGWQSRLPTFVPVRVAGGFQWPNNITPAPMGGFVFGDGFLVPGKSDGAVFWVDANQTLWRLTAPEKGWFYHKALFFDGEMSAQSFRGLTFRQVNGDGRADIVTARGRKPLFGAAAGELLWLEQPADPTAVPWAAHKLADGPDIGIDLLPSGSGRAWVFAAEFFGKRVSFFELRGGVVALRGAVDATEGEMYSVRALPGSAPRSVALFATNYRYSGAGSVFLYEGQLGGTLNRTVVASGFHNRQLAPGSGAPGWLFPHWPTSGNSSGPVSLIVCGDGAETFTLLSPSGSGRWAQTFQEDYSSTVGSAAVGDFDGDGFTDVVVTDYNKGLVHGYTYSPK